MKKTILLLIITLFSVSTLVQAKNYYIRMATNSSDWSNITADTAHIIVDYMDGDSFNAIINAYLATDTVWVAKGTYTIDKTIALKASQKLFGGFAGTESSLTGRVLSDLDGNGLVEPWEFTNATEIISSIPAVNSITLGANSIIDGFTVRNINNSSGTGTAASTIINIYSGVSGCILRNMIVKDCYVSSGTSAGVFTVNASNGTLQNCLIQNNTTEVLTGGSGTSFGGGLYLSSTSAKAIGCVIRGNKSINVTVTKAKGGGVFMQTGSKLINCVVYNNQAQGQGGGVFMNDAASQAINCTVARNKAGLTGGGVYMNTGAIFNNSIVWSNMENSSATADANDVYYGGNAVGNFTTDYLAYGVIAKSDQAVYPALANVKILTSGEFADNTIDGTGTFAPKFLNPTAFVGAPSDPTAVMQANFKLVTGSPCLDFGSKTLLDNLGITTDLMNTNRFGNTTPDLGAYELSINTALNNVSDKSLYSVFKNGKNLIVKGLNGETNISLYELNGTLLQSINLNQSLATISVSNKGVYIVKIRTLTNTETVKVIF
jgi:hypothetical protein